MNFVNTGFAEGSCGYSRISEAPGGRSPNSSWWKRQVYGRCKVDLLQARLIGFTS